MESKSHTMSVNRFTFSLSKFVLLMFLTAVLMENESCFFFSKAKQNFISCASVKRLKDLCFESGGQEMASFVLC